jgi:hypothetical protein
MRVLGFADAKPVRGEPVEAVLKAAGWMPWKG